MKRVEPIVDAAIQKAIWSSSKPALMLFPAEGCPVCEMSALSQALGVYCGQIKANGFCYYSNNMKDTCDFRKTSCAEDPTSSSCSYYQVLVSAYGQCPFHEENLMDDFCTSLADKVNLRNLDPPAWCNAVAEDSCNSSFVTYEWNGALAYQQCEWRDLRCRATKNERGDDVIYPCADTCSKLPGATAVKQGSRCHTGNEEGRDRLRSEEVCESYYMDVFGDYFPCKWIGGSNECVWDSCPHGTECFYACNCIPEIEPCKKISSVCCREHCGPC